MKHVYTDEWWETRLQDIKLYRIFVFDIVIMKKPLFDRSLTLEEDENKEKQKEKEKIQLLEQNA